jgi:hypothetical protein
LVGVRDRCPDQDGPPRGVTHRVEPDDIALLAMPSDRTIAFGCTPT